MAQENSLGGWVTFVSKGGGMNYEEWIQGVYDTDDEAYEALDAIYIRRMV